MKKIILPIAIVGVAMMVACSAEKKAEDKGAALKAKIENCSDPDSLKAYVQEAKAYADQLVKEGKDAAATEFINAVSPAVEAKDPSQAATFAGLDIKAKADSLIDAAKESAGALVDSAANTANDLKEAAAEKVEQGKEAVASTVEQAKEAAAEKVEQGKEAAAAAVEQGKEAAKNAADDAKAKAADAAQKGADKVKGLLK